jgi:hypothetical protein
VHEPEHVFDGMALTCHTRVFYRKAPPVLDWTKFTAYLSFLNAPPDALLLCLDVFGDVSFLPSSCCKAPTKKTLEAPFDISSRPFDVCRILITPSDCEDMLKARDMLAIQRWFLSRWLTFLEGDLYGAQVAMGWMETLQTLKHSERSCEMLQQEMNVLSDRLHVWMHHPKYQDG